MPRILSSASASLHIVKTVNYYRERDAIRGKETRCGAYWEINEAEEANGDVNGIFLNDGKQQLPLAFNIASLPRLKS